MRMPKKDDKNIELRKKGIKNWFHSHSKKQITACLVFMIALPIGAGVGAGIVISKFFLSKSTDYSDINVNDLKEDVTGIMDQYKKAKDNGKEYSEVFKPYELVNIAYELYSQHDNSKSISVGRANAAIVDQSIRACSIKNGNEYMEESISKSSIVSLAARTYLHENSNIDFHDGDAKSSVEGEWPDTHYEYTSDEYADVFGKTPKSPLIYIVGKKTIKSAASKVEKTDSGYIVNLELNPIKSVVNYVKQMKNLSKLADYPSFDSVKATFTLDNDLLIKQLSVDESYYAKTGAVGADITAHLDIYYEVDGDFAIPSLSQAVSYGEYEK